MSAAVFGALNRKRKKSPKEQNADSKTTEPPGLKPYVDILAALVPGEVLAAHFFFVSLATQPKTNKAGELVTEITDPSLLFGSFFFLIALSIVGWVAGDQFKDWDGLLDVLRMTLPALAFVGWAMAQKPSAFDAVMPNLSQERRYAYAAGIAALVGGLSWFCTDKADKRNTS
jgi:hypothetical protein